MNPIAFKITMLGPLLGLLGATIMLITALVTSQMYYGGFEFNIRMVLMYVNSIVTGFWAGLAVYGAILSFRGNRKGSLFMLIAGIGGIIGTFIPIYYNYIDYNGYGYTQIIKLNSTAMFIDVVLILIGGILGYSLQARD